MSHIRPPALLSSLILLLTAGCPGPVTTWPEGTWLGEVDGTEVKLIIVQGVEGLVYGMRITEGGSKATFDGTVSLTDGGLALVPSDLIGWDIIFWGYHHRTGRRRWNLRRDGDALTISVHPPILSRTDTPTEPRRGSLLMLRKR